MQDILNRLRSLVSALHSYQYASLDRDRVGRDDIDHSVKIGTMKLVILPFLGLTAIPPLIIAAIIGVDASSAIIAVAALVSVFVPSWFTDRVYDQQRVDIKTRATEILDEPEKGRNWARRKIAAIIIIQLAVLFVLAALGRLFVVYGSGEPFIAV